MADEKQTRITLTESEKGFRLEVEGKSLKEMFSCCCFPLAVSCCETRTACCPPDKEQK
jgi:hypothetical protein